MILPMSKTACERLFSPMNNIKTELAEILHVKQAVKEQCGCVNFTPSKNMVKVAQSSTALYKKMDATEN